jgi:hypothetical protein
MATVATHHRIELGFRPKAIGQPRLISTAINGDHRHAIGYQRIDARCSNAACCAGHHCDPAH